MTRPLAALVDDAVRRLAEAGCPVADARTDAGVIGRAILGWDAAAWLARQRDPAPVDFADRLDQAIARRATHEPVAYITGERQFYGRAFRVTRDVLIPRPETELVVEAALRILRDAAPRPKPQAPSRVIDVGTGSGCIAVTIACEAPGVIVTATDISPASLAIARENACRHGVADRVTFIEASLIPAGGAGATSPGPAGPWDLMVSNPPYVPRRDRASLAPDVRDFEPDAALFGGDDGLDVIRFLVPQAVDAIAPGGALVMEIGAGQSEAVATILNATGAFGPTRVDADLQGIPRVISCRTGRPPRR